MVMLPDYATLEEHITAKLQTLPTLANVELEPVKGGEDTPELQTREAITFSFATTGR